VNDQDQAVAEHARALQAEQAELEALAVRLSSSREQRQTAVQDRERMTFMERVLEREAREEAERAQAATREAEATLRRLQAEADDMRRRVDDARNQVSEPCCPSARKIDSIRPRLTSHSLYAPVHPLYFLRFSSFAGAQLRGASVGAGHAARVGISRIAHRSQRSARGRRKNSRG
jgi:hypothetical protein